MSKKVLISLAVVSIILSVFGITWLFISENNKVRYGFVNTEKLLASFLESQKAMQIVRNEDEKWRNNLDIIQDSLNAFENRMMISYETKSLTEKKALKEEQIRRIEEMRRFEKAQVTKIDELRVQKLQEIYDKINSALIDYANRKGLDLIFATSNGNIVFGDGAALDLTKDFSLFLNERFR